MSGTVHSGGEYANGDTSYYKADIEEMYVLIKGKKYECKLEKQNKTDDDFDEDEEDDYDDEEDDDDDGCSDEVYIVRRTK